MSKENKELYEFDKFHLDVSERFLLRNGKRVALADRAFDTLCVLVRRGNQLVGKDELMTEVWADAIVEENNLDKNISALRRILGERNGKQRFIETVRGHGYRFVAEVRRVDGDTETRKREDAERSEPAAVAGGFSEVESREPSVESDLESQISNLKSQNTETNKTKGEGQKTKPLIRNWQSGNVVALAAWRHDAKGDAPPEEIIETGLAATADKPKRISAVETANGETPELAPTGEKTKHHRRNYLPAVIALTIVLVGIGYGLYKFFNRPPIEFRADKVTQFTTTGKTKIAAVSLDGKYLASVQANGEQQSLWVRQVVAENNVQILPPSEISFRGLNFSPDGNRIFYVVGNALFQIPALGGSPKKVLENINSNGIGFSPDGKQFAFVRYSKEASAIFIADADGTNERELYSLPRPETLTNFPVWSPDGKVIACSIRHARANNYVLAVQIADAAAVPINSQRATTILQLAWLPDSKGLLMIGVAENKTSVVARIYQMSYPGGELRRITNEFSPYTNFSLTADGRSLFAVRIEIIAHVWTMPSNDANQIKQLTAGQDKYDGMFGLGWMPDGRIFYESKPGGRAETVVMNADGGNAKQVLKDGYTTTVSPDGRFFVYQKVVADEEIGLFRLDLSDNTEKRLTIGYDMWTTVTPNGKQVLFTRTAGEQMGAYRVSIDGGDRRRFSTERR